MSFGTDGGIFIPTLFVWEALDTSCLIFEAGLSALLNISLLQNIKTQSNNDWALDAFNPLASWHCWGAEHAIASRSLWIFCFVLWCNIWCVVASLGPSSMLSDSLIKHLLSLFHFFVLKRDGFSAGRQTAVLYLNFSCRSCSLGVCYAGLVMLPTKLCFCALFEAVMSWVEGPQSCKVWNFYFLYFYFLFIFFFWGGGGGRETFVVLGYPCTENMILQCISPSLTMFRRSHTITRRPAWSRRFFNEQLWIISMLLYVRAQWN